VQLGKQLGRVAGRDLSDESAQRAGEALHRTLGMSYEMAASMLVGRGVRPVIPGPAMGIAAFILADEGTSISWFPGLSDGEPHARNGGTQHVRPCRRLPVMAGRAHLRPPETRSRRHGYAYSANIAPDIGGPRNDP
jgi:hypothetical protein